MNATTKGILFGAVVEGLGGMIFALGIVQSGKFPPAPVFLVPGVALMICGTGTIVWTVVTAKKEK